jgi:hypothetical protein
MLPFLKKDKEASVSVPVDVQKREPDEESDYDTLESAADDLISAIHAKDTKGVCVALRAAFELLDSEPHDEGPHTNEE